MMITYKDAFVKLALRSNKNGTEDYGNIDKAVASEAINKAINDFIRRQYHGGNIFKEGAEESRQRVDDLQVLLKTRRLALNNKDFFSESVNFPSDYRYYNRFSIYDKKEACSNLLIINSQLVEESNVDALLSNDGTAPSKDFEQCFHTLIGNKINLYHNKEFDVKEGLLTYYKNPKIYNAFLPDEVFEFKDDVVELIIDEAAKIINGDFDNFNQQNRLKQSVEENN